MQANSTIKKIALATAVLAIGVFAYVIHASKALSYLSDDPKACINCHVMNTQYATWQHSSHAGYTTCISCHLPQDSFLDKYLSKARDGWNHAVVFTADSYDHAIRISEDGARRVQENCIACHDNLVDELGGYRHTTDAASQRKCWECHKGVPHGKVRGLMTTPDNLGVKEPVRNR